MSKSILLRSLALASLIAAVGIGTSDAAENEPHHHRPPQAAFDACQSKQEGATCEVALPDRTVTGTCAATPQGTLACRPDHPMGPPPELVQACSGKNDGDACVATHGDHSEDGVCRRGRSGTLICVP